jgi:DNA polymerase-3 subunit alpha
MSDFVHLHSHSIYSALDGVATPREYFEECAKRQYPAHALTEHGNMASVPDAYWASQDTGVKYIPGCELYYNDQELQRRQLEADGTKMKDIEDEILKNRLMRQRHLLVLCKTTDGYRNLLDIKKKSYDFFYRKPRTNFKLLYENRQDLIILSGCMNGPMSFELRNYIQTEDVKYKEKAIKIAKTFHKVFKEDFYVELQMPGVEQDAQLFHELQHIADDLKIKTVMTNDSHYITEEDYNLQRIMMSIEQDLPFDSPDLFISKSRNGFLKSRNDLRRTFEQGHKVGDEILPPYNTDGIGLKEFESACDTTLEIADKCDTFKPDTSTKLPIMENEKDQLWKLVCKGLIEKGLNDDKRYKDRIKFEMDRIIDKEFSSYFLICRDLVQKSTMELNMPVGPRGSAGGSLVCYLIGIHDIDPIKWDLSFDRFLSNSRGGKMLRVNMDDDKEV